MAAACLPFVMDSCLALYDCWPIKQRNMNPISRLSSSAFVHGELLASSLFSNKA